MYKSIYLALPMLFTSYYMNGADFVAEQSRSYDTSTMYAKLNELSETFQQRALARQDNNPDNRKVLLNCMASYQNKHNALLSDVTNMVNDITQKNSNVKTLQQELENHTTLVVSDKHVLSHLIGLMDWANVCIYNSATDAEQYDATFISSEVDRKKLDLVLPFNAYASKARSVYESFHWISKPSIPAEAHQLIEASQYLLSLEKAYSDESTKPELRERLALQLQKEDRFINNTFEHMIQQVAKNTHTVIQQQDKDKTEKLRTAVTEIAQTQKTLTDLEYVASHMLLHLSEDTRSEKISTEELIRQLTACPPETAATLAQMVNMMDAGIKSYDALVAASEVVDPTTEDAKTFEITNPIQ